MQIEPTNLALILLIAFIVLSSVATAVFNSFNKRDKIAAIGCFVLFCTVCAAVGFVWLGIA